MPGRAPRIEPPDQEAVRGMHSQRPAGRSSQPRRLVILHADDFGMNDAVNRGIIDGFTHGLLTSTAVLANAPGCSSALAAWKELQARFGRGELPSADSRRRLADSHAPLDLGIHLNLTQGRPLTGSAYPAQLLSKSGTFPGIFGLAVRLLASRWKYQNAIRSELCAQIEMLLDHGIAPSHLNGHQYVETLPVVSAMIPELLKRYAISVVRMPWERHLTKTTLVHRFEPANWCLAQIKRLFACHYLVRMRRHAVVYSADYFGTSHAGRVDLELMRQFLGAARSGITEIGLHPGTLIGTKRASESSDDWHDPLAQTRPRELSLLVSSELVELLATQQVSLGRLGDLAVRQNSRSPLQQFAMANLQWPICNPP
ncbi:MAG TPA: ChbG/HpnK family deacetylase [Planctomycetaceae bacterium]|nr:ChbG/HpnK family deacetylase [Planctomycetaceae bacterium]